MSQSDTTSQSDAAPKPEKNTAADGITFSELSLPEKILKVLTEIGYERPSPIQSASIPVLQSGVDLIGQAQTGTGKTAAFALPLLAKIDLSNSKPQALVLAPTRELAIQVAEAFKTYSRYLPGFQVLPVYGGQSMSQQLRQLKRGAQVIVGTPGRIMDHMRRGKLVWDAMHTLVLDEADEMLRMGFLEDVEWILEQTPENRQIALFSATMPKEIRRVADRFLTQPKEIKIKTKTTTAVTIKQQYLSVSNNHKLDALTRILEVEETDAVIIFARTKTATVELADKLNARGYASAAINGDMQQSAREQTIEHLKRGKLDILIATDVAARGLDVQRISHVINYDITQDVESYVHRIGRTGRAGREGTAILFVTPRERRMLSLIERVTGTKVQRIGLPSTDTINDQRVEKFKLKITEKIESGELQPYLEILEAYQYETNQTGLHVAAALASLAHDKTPLLLEDLPSPREDRRSRDNADNYGRERKNKRKGKEQFSRSGKDFSKKAERLENFPDIDMERFVLMVGFQNGIKPANVVGAIANEVNVESKYIGHIKIYDEFTTVDLPEGMPKESLAHLKKVRVCGIAMNLTRAKEFSLDKLSGKNKSKEAKDSHKRGDRKDRKKGERKSRKRDK
ncbi:DEAD/DEAH box helicase [Aliikangiella coralliicola]|uniref:ATP-dependent RNA helicase DeaD n=1 Tax=Aliikangiella coralliicola TaxID=2592383 RepID=A0A545UAB7_9GAMM|nr:DEAD/DEAH box helicase [Aliikangiella coralliicola]TQV86389.1 DEAD/DEAH box helicase [Aliikangiella coralliicola]